MPIGGSRRRERDVERLPNERIETLNKVSRAFIATRWGLRILGFIAAVLYTIGKEYKSSAVRSSGMVIVLGSGIDYLHVEYRKHPDFTTGFGLACALAGTVFLIVHSYVWFYSDETASSMEYFVFFIFTALSTSLVSLRFFLRILGHDAVIRATVDGQYDPEVVHSVAFEESENDRSWFFDTLLAYVMDSLCDCCKCFSKALGCC